MTVPQLLFGIDNASASNTIYVTGVASVNDLTLKIGTTGSATFTPAPKVVDKPQASTTTGSLLYLDLTPLHLTQQEFAAITPATTDWQIVAFPNDQLLGMTPKSKVTITEKDTIKISIGPLADDQAPGASASLTVLVYRVDGITVSSLPFPTNFSVALASPPTGGEALNQDLMVELATPDVVNTVPGYDSLTNQLCFAFFAGPRGRPVTPTADTEFILSFVYATDPSGYGALCTPDQTKPPFAVVAGTNADDWKITSNWSQESPSWTLKPPTTHPIVSTTRRTVGILVNNVITTFQPGPTVALMSYSGLPGYTDGIFTMLIEKHGHVRIDALTVQPNPSILKDGVAQISIAWKVENAGTMLLAPFHVDVTGKTGYSPAMITDTTQITLVAEGTVLANAGNIAVRNTTAQVLPVINSFVAQPRAVYAGDLPRDIQLSWNVNTNEQLQLLSSTQPPDPNKYAPVGMVTKTVDGPQMFTLRPLGQPIGSAVERSIVVSAFAPQVRSWPIAAKFLAAPPNASFVLASDGAGTVVAVDTMVYQPVSDPVPVGTAPAGMAFSADGSMLYVANSGDGTVSAIAVAATGKVPQYSFTPQSTTPVGGAPQQLVLSPDGAYLYVTVDNGTNLGQLAVLSTGKSPAVVGRVIVGVAPRGVAVMPSGAQIFVANSGSSTVTVVGRGSDSHHSMVDTVTGVPSAQDVAVTPNGDVLLVACPTANTVITLNAVYLQAPRASLQVGASPRYLALVPGGAYAVVANQDDGTVSLLAVGSTPAQCRVLQSGIAVGPSPSAVAVTPDAGLVLVGSGLSSSPSADFFPPDAATGLSVLTLAEYQTEQTLPGIGGQPTNVIAAPDGKTVVGWHNAYTFFSIGKPSTGLFVYDIASKTVTPLLAEIAVVDIVFHPTAATTAFLVDNTHLNVTIRSRDTWKTTDTIDLTGQTVGLPHKLAISGDGTTLFVLTVPNTGTPTEDNQKCELVVFSSKDSWTSHTPLGTVKLFDPPGSPLTLATAPDSSAAYVTDNESGNLLVVKRGKDGSYALEGSPVAVGTYPLAIALSPDGSRLYVASEGTSNGSLAEVSTATLAVRSVVLPANSYTSLAALTVSPDGTRVFATDHIAVGVRVFDANSLRLVQTISWTSGAQMLNGIAVAPDGSRIFTANTLSANLGIIAQVQGGKTSPVPTPVVAAEVTQKPQVLGNGTSYQGLFLRDYVGQTPQDPPSTDAWSDCPDIWPAGEQPLSDATATLVTGYGNGSPNVVYTAEGSGDSNYIYVRGLNATNGPNTSRVWLHYVDGSGDPSLMVWPANWLKTGISAGGTQSNYADVSSANPNEVSFTQSPFLWNAVPTTGHYCIIAWIENPPKNPPDDPTQSLPSIGTYADLATFIQNHPNMGWKNTVDKPTPSGKNMQLHLDFKGPQRGGRFHVGLQFTKIPTDGEFSFTMAGPTSELNVEFVRSPVSNPDETPMVRTDWTGHNGFNSTMVVNYWVGNTQPPRDANIVVITGTNASELVGLVDDPLARAVCAQVYPTGAREDGFRGETITIVGSVQINVAPQ